MTDLGEDAGFEARLEALDLGLFDAIPTQSSPDDRRGWLALQRLVRRGRGYVYLEIGSHLGGSLQQHLQDPKCRRLWSIDPRPLVQPDDRGGSYAYPGNSTARMLEGLRRAAPQRIDRLVCLEEDAGSIDPARIIERPSFCFIDGEHTHHAVLSDFAFCRGVVAADAVIGFHDAGVVAPALREILAQLRAEGVSFAALKLAGDTFAIFLGALAAIPDPYVRATGVDGVRWLRHRRWKEIVAPPVRALLAKLLGR